ncbi:MAG TPA: hypothetical protein PLM53_00075 [Spirochaetota bacterium]|nr:hypothetical protein [Spirochaetota bacterium]HPC43063.1 hypothetical protein [Spirochaetota bacterium]HPL17288.1 hypothetical protein [Spirochaetota bacterium]HQF06919.1 hypothetical protein [Spirochaetota bacterium]HQH95462.1 hypothetical protein [Spirochaetota bacterium]
MIKEAAKDTHRPVQEKESREGLSFFHKLFPEEKKGAREETRPAPPPRQDLPLVGKQPAERPGRTVTFTLQNLFSVCGSAFTAPKIGTASAAITATFLVFLAGNWLARQAIDPGDIAGNEVLKSLLGIVPFAIIMFMYIMTSAVISRFTLNTLSSRASSPQQGLGRFIAGAIAPVFLANVLIFIIIDLVFILFGRIPVIGPVLFAVLFLPIYLASLCAVLLLAVGFWFYPPIIATFVPGGTSPLIGLFKFIRRQNFSLAYTIPLMTIITAVTFAAIYILHYGSFSLSMFLSKAVLGDEDLKVFSSIPSAFLQFSDLTITGSDSGLYKSLVSDILLSHSIGGFIIGMIFSLISILLFASFISITATLSTHIYLMLDRGTDMDDTSKIRLLALLVLILLGVFLAKKIFL